MLGRSSICLWLSAFVFEAGAFCQSYSSFIHPGDGAALLYDTSPNSINEKGEIAGYWRYQHSARGGFVRAADGTVTTFDLPHSISVETAAFSINAAGAITGYYRSQPPALGALRGFVRDPEGNFTTFDPPGSISTMPQSINAGGAITGYYNEANLVIHGFVREPSGHIISFDAPGSISTKPVGINFDGAIAGFYNEANLVNHGFIRNPNGEIISFDPPESTGTIVAAINNSGAITGSYTVANGRTFGFVRDPNGKFTSFDPGLNTRPTSINNEGAITGSYSDAAETHGFVRAPGGSITSFDPPLELCPVVPSFPVRTMPTSINDAGVITGFCQISAIVLYRVGWVRFPPTPPAVSCSATPNMLWPPNGKPVVVTVSGTVTPGTQPISSGIAAYAVTDEYGQVQPSGTITLGSGGSYSFGVSLIAARNGDDHDGRTYAIVVGAKDAIGNLGSCSTVVTVPHDQGK